MQYATGVYWCGKKAARPNQDAVVLQQVLTRRGRVLMAAVCDGMGGLSAGGKASGYVAKQLVEWYYGELLCLIRRKKPFWVIRRSLDRRVFHIQMQLKKFAVQQEIALGTTMTALVLWEKTYLLWHLGDSRAYLLRGRSMEQMTVDHVQEEQKLTKCVGSFGFFAPQHGMGRLRKGEGIFLCTDGFRRRISDQELCSAMRFGSADVQTFAPEEQIARWLKEIGGVCRKRGERDDLSAVYVRGVI